MNVTPAGYCKRCQFYHGADKVVCGLHPYGPDTEICSDYEFKALGKGEAIRDTANTGHYYSGKDWQHVLMLSVLIGAITFGWAQGWLLIYEKFDPPTKPTTRSGWVR